MIRGAPLKQKIIWLGYALALTLLVLTNHDVFNSNSFELQALLIIINIGVVWYGWRLNAKKPEEDYQVSNKALIIGFLIMSPIIAINLMSVKHVTTYPLTLLFYDTFLAPFVEEVVFRQTWFAKVFNSNKLYGITVTGLIFILIHAPQNPAVTLYYIVATASLFTSYIISKNDLRVSTAIHLTVNIISAVLILY